MPLPCEDHKAYQKLIPDPTGEDGEPGFVNIPPPILMLRNLRYRNEFRRKLIDIDHKSDFQESFEKSLRREDE